MPHTDDAVSFRAPWSKTLKSVSILMTVLFLGAGAIFYQRLYPFAPAGLRSISSLVAVLMPLVAAFFTITGYTIRGNRLLIHRLGWKSAVDLQSLKAAKFDPRAIAGSWRTFGNGGLYSFSGWFSSDALGSYRAFFTDPARAVVITLGERKIVVSPDDPERFVEVLLSHIRSE